jgi:NAD(P)-dependent dehydrogenase (short-subunit alcohol dehydrogenase family)
MLAARRGKIINIASLLSFQGGIRVASYTASKSGIAGLTRLLANEWAGKGVNVNAIAPGFMDTDMTQGLEAEQREQVARRSALRRLPDVEEVADAVDFLLGPKARSITGTVLTVDAGTTA